MTGALEDFLRKQERPPQLLPEITERTLFIKEFNTTAPNKELFSLREYYDHTTSLIARLHSIPGPDSCN
jgi:hypothetical protein